MLTGRGVWLLLAAALTWLVGRTLGIGELYAVAVACLGIVVVGVLFVRQSTSAVSVRRVVTADRVLHGEPIHVSLDLRNDGRVMSPTLLVADALPGVLHAEGQPDLGTARFVVGGLGPGTAATVSYRAVASTRGRYRIGPVTLRLRDPFGVAERVRVGTATADVIVYPAIEALPAGQVRGTHMGTGSSDRRRVMAGGEEFYGVREYVRGDDLRSVHWASTAHRQQLMVRQMEQPWQPHATLYLDSRAASHSPGPTGSLERSVSVAASLLYHLADRGYALRLVTDADTGRGGATPWEESLDRLAVLVPSGNSGLGPSVTATRGGEGLFAAVIGVPPGREDPARHPDLRALFGVRGFGHRLVVICGPEPGGQRSTRTAALLAAQGWSVSVLGPTDRLADAWPDLLSPSSGARGTRPSAGGPPPMVGSRP